MPVEISTNVGLRSSFQRNTGISFQSIHVTGVMSTITPLKTATKTHIMFRDTPILTEGTRTSDFNLKKHDQTLQMFLADDFRTQIFRALYNYSNSR